MIVVDFFIILILTILSITLVPPHNRYKDYLHVSRRKYIVILTYLYINIHTIFGYMYMYIYINPPRRH
jgi:hypothetical protein